MKRISPIGDVVIELSEIDSTNNYAMRLINEGMAEHGIVIRADFQTAGKGQLGNVWQAEESKNLLCSIILDTSAYAIEKQFYLNAIACLGVSDILMKHYDLRDVSIKWPNDIYAGNKKIAGILIENQIRGSKWTHAVVGIGLNVNQQKFSDLNRASSILLEKNDEYKVKTVLKQLMKSLNHYYLRISEYESDLLSQYNKLLYMLGKEINFKRNFEYHKGIVQGVNNQGLLEIVVNDKVKKFKHKEIEMMLT